MKVTVIIPTYNYASFIGNAIKSVLAQTCKDWDIIVMDDGSTDNTKAVVEKFVREYPGRIFYHVQKNQGSGAARNNAIRLATGEYIAFLDADDLWLPGKLEHQMKLFQNDPQLTLVYSNAYLVRKGRILGAYIRPDDKCRINEDLFYNLLLRNFIPFASTVVKRSVFDEHLWFDETLYSAQDFEWLMRVIRRHKAGYVDKCLVRYRMHTANVSNRLDIRHKNNLTIIDRNLSLYPEMAQKLGHRLKVRLAEQHYSYGYTLFAAQRMREAREQFAEAIFFSPFYSATLYAYVLLTFCPPVCLAWLRGIKQKLFKPPERISGPGVITARKSSVTEGAIPQ